VGSALSLGRQRLEDSGIADPQREALQLWAALAGASPGAVWLTRADPAPRHLTHRFQQAIERRAVGEPAAYATGVAGFRTLDLTVDRRVLIPRPETEGLVQLILERCEKDSDPWGDALDLGTGSGCIALSLAVEGRFRRVVATDASAAATTVARENVRRLAPATPVEVREGAFFTPVARDNFRVIVSNPPYVAEAEYQELQDSVRLWEPSEALVSADGGMWHLRTILGEAAAHLEPGGLMALEVDCSRAERTAALARELGWAAEVRSDHFGRDRYIVATRECVQ